MAVGAVVEAFEGVQVLLEAGARARDEVQLVLLLERLRSGVGLVVPGAVDLLDGPPETRMSRRTSGRKRGPSLRKKKTSTMIKAVVTTPEPAATTVLSDWFPATTGEIVHVDGGAHAMGM